MCLSLSNAQTMLQFGKIYISLNREKEAYQFSYRRCPKTSATLRPQHGFIPILYLYDLYRYGQMCIRHADTLFKREQV